MPDKIKVSYKGLMPTLTEKKLILVHVPQHPSEVKKGQKLLCSCLVYDPDKHKMGVSDEIKLKKDLIL